MKQQPRQEKSHEAILRPEEVRQRTALKATVFYDIQNPSSPFYDPSFPKSFSLTGGRSRGYLASEVDGWIQGRVATRLEGARK